MSFEKTVQVDFLDFTTNTRPFEKRPVAGRDTAVEYFAGIGLVRLGLEQAGWKILFSNDFSKDKYEMYSAYYDDARERYHVEDIHQLDVNLVPQTFLATASFPCIDLSLAGKGNGINGEHSSAFWGFTEILQRQRENKPSLVLLENVEGWLYSNDGSDFRLTIQALNELGYSCDVYSLNAVRFTPQSRPRIFAVGMRASANNDISRFQRRSKALATSRLKEVVLKNRDLQWHILSVNPPPNRRSDGLEEIIEDMPDEDPRWWSQEKVSHHIQMMASSHLERVEDLKQEAAYRYRTIYRRMRKGEQRAEVRRGNTAGCLRTARGGSSRQIIIRAGKGTIKMRHMTPREYARLQGVPDIYPIPDDTVQALTGFGDAVCVPVITWLAENILNPLTFTI